jgi:hypothetical protein
MSGEKPSANTATRGFTRIFFSDVILRSSDKLGDEESLRPFASLTMTKRESPGLPLLR